MSDSGNDAPGALVRFREFADVVNTPAGARIVRFEDARQQAKQANQYIGVSMDTNATIHQLLTQGQIRFEAAKLAAGTEVHELKDRLKAFYEKYHGAVGLDALDWHWQATALKNHLANEGEPKHDAASETKPDAPPAPDATTHPVNYGSDPYTTGLGEGVTQQGVDHPVATPAAGMPTSLGTPLEVATPSIKPKPDAEDPTDASMLKVQPTVTDPVQGGVTAVPGSPAIEPPPASHTPQ